MNFYTIVFRRLKKSIFYLIAFILLTFSAPIIIIAARLVKSKKIRLVWGEAPIINNPLWARAMKAGGYNSESYTDGYCKSINAREDYDLILQERFRFLPNELQKVFGFYESLIRYDVFFISFNGFFLGLTPFWFFEAYLLKLAGKKVVVIPFGADAYIYRRVRSVALLHGLMMSLPFASTRQNYIQKKVDYWCKHANAVIAGIMGPDGLGRWDAIIPSVLHLNVDEWTVSNRNSMADGVKEIVYVGHAPNHRGFKGSEFVVEAVRQLQNEGVKVELVLIEGKPNSEVKNIFQNKLDILVEQLICPGHGLTAIEGMATGLTVISNLDDDDYLLPFRRWSYFNECPLVSANPESLKKVLGQLISSPQLRTQLGNASREYVEKYHGQKAAIFFYSKVIDFIYGKEKSIINLFHPLISKRLDTIQHPLNNNKLPDR